MPKAKETKAFGVYQIRNVIDGKIYVGSTSRSFEKRWYGWKADLRRNKGNSHLLAAWDKYGADNFRFEILEVVASKEDVLARESFWMLKLGTRDPSVGYNFAHPETRAISNHGKEVLSERSKALWADPNHRAKVSEALKKRFSTPEAKAELSARSKANWADPDFRKAAEERFASEEFKQKLSKAQKGKHANSEEHRAATSARFKGCSLSPEHIEAVRKSRTGAKASEETRAKISAAQKGRKQSPETIAKRAASLKGVPKSEEHKAKMRESWKSRPPVSDETREKLRISHLGNTSRLGTGKKK